MIIDNYDAAVALTEKLQASLPIKARAGKEFLKTLKQRGEATDPDQEFLIDSVNYSGDMGGIMCALASNTEEKERYVVSITHLIIDPNHPLAAEVQKYQRQRTRKLMPEHQEGFSAELLAQASAKKRKRTSGFGK
ncbi:hypothetical protein [Fischerella sp. JS2]|uniref:hypothetical protein n=1 Tax=Fischerella sp. JS2 TaxID=2597771 RepID=UPI0028E5B36A|nr:hypothetical protein [Fischerella sp. JS2]